jgi:hypothetical protein
MTEIVRASLGLPTLRAGLQFQNPKPVLVIWILVIRICFGFRYSDFGFKLSPWLVNRNGYRNLVSTVCGAKAIGV